MKRGRYLFITDDPAWVKESGSDPVVVRSEVPDAAIRRKILVEEATKGIERVVLLERGEWIGEGDPPDLLLITDQIAFLDSTIVDTRGPKGEITFVDMTKPFSSEALNEAERRCEEAGLVVRRGCVAGIRALELLTPTERRAIHSLGADAVAVAIPHEVRWARTAGLEVLAAVMLKKIPIDRLAFVFG